MPDTFNYPVEIERDEDGRFVVTFLDFGWGATDPAQPNIHSESPRTRSRP